MKPATVDQSVARIRAYARLKNLRPSRLAQDAGLHANTLRDFHREDWNPTLETVRRIEAIIPPDFTDGDGASGIRAGANGEAA